MTTRNLELLVAATRRRLSFCRSVPFTVFEDSSLQLTRCQVAAARRRSHHTAFCLAGGCVSACSRFPPVPFASFCLHACCVEVSEFYPRLLLLCVAFPLLALSLQRKREGRATALIANNNNKATLTFTNPPQLLTMIALKYRCNNNMRGAQPAILREKHGDFALHSHFSSSSTGSSDHVERPAAHDPLHLLRIKQQNVCKRNIS